MNTKATCNTGIVDIFWDWSSISTKTFVNAGIYAWKSLFGKWQQLNIKYIQKN